MQNKQTNKQTNKHNKQKNFTFKYENVNATLQQDGSIFDISGCVDAIITSDVAQTQIYDLPTTNSNKC